MTSVCTGASILAAAGLLDAAPIFVRDGPVITAAGITSALDLTLALVEEDHGSDLARLVSRVLVTYLQRPGTQAQVSPFTAAAPPVHDPLRRVVEHVHADLGADLSATALAGVAGLSPRQLARSFARHLHQSPASYVRTARTRAAARLLETTDLPLPAIAARTGLGTSETLRKAFARHYGLAPSAHRAASRQHAMRQSTTSTTAP
ncbi:GlxA family transcriptional regulator [Kineococcus vitellinus]|uniref:GlxA family transcriptional regulator n=1 Tax=Kineococcus vitellinus TaxID=2696565 RepID=UPI00196B0EDE|nr:helix-turn-helix domain-containing protein [Kineococcus vitellinus]